MKIRWSDSARDDVGRLTAFLADVAPSAGAKVASDLTAAPDKLLALPRRGRRLAGHPGREVRSLIVGNYDLRYEIADDMIEIVRIHHQRENR